MAPLAGLRVVVAHDSWPYFARRFGLVVMAAIEPSPGVPPSPQSLGALTARMREVGVRLIIAEPWSNTAVVNQIAERSGARAVILASSVGAEPEARDYLALFDLDIRRLVEAAAASR
jgi:ABC-type Zn uptake system ZnuABC Zn-binding protein ZnuA